MASIDDKASDVLEKSLFDSFALFNTKRGQKCGGTSFKRVIFEHVEKWF